MEPNGRLTLRELEFLAEEELVTIVPRFQLSELRFVSGTFGGFEAGIPVQVPLWLALKLKDDQMCHLECPSWMELEKLKEVWEQERSEARLSALPHHYLGIASLILSRAPEDVSDVDQVAKCIRDVEDLRAEKLRKVREIPVDQAEDEDPDEKSDAKIVSNIGAIEVASLRDDYLKVMDHLLNQRRAESQIKEAEKTRNEEDEEEMSDTEF
eukprot:gb/GECG01000015.1/.p1 GENE.gb/GECG01000015.1/~~gb/GECG01000015.1/.p1  ORF type:complete len:211 (+),score=37.05 gb/GECG01000015.1/:1-633(+)